MRFLAFYVILGAVLVTIFFKGALLMGRYGITATGRRCDENATGNISHEYIFTTTVYGIVSVLRLIEYAVLGKQFHYFLFTQKHELSFTNSFKQYRWHLLLFSILSLPYLLLALIVPALGIYQEIEHSKRCCKDYDQGFYVFTAYCAVNVLRYLLAYIVRLIMMLTTLALRNYWLLEITRPPTASNQYEHLVSTDSDSPDSNGSDLQDWRIVSVDFQKRFGDYTSIGEQVSIINELFQTWFIIPWVTYFIVSSQKTQNILGPWNTGVDCDSGIPQMYYMFYNINQFITLVIPYLCAKKINAYHQEYCKEIRMGQMKKFKDDPCRLSYARQLLIRKEEEYDFMPRIPGTSVTISIGNSLYIVFLLVGLFLSVSESLLS